MYSIFKYSVPSTWQFAMLSFLLLFFLIAGISERRDRVSCRDNVILHNRSEMVYEKKEITKPAIHVSDPVVEDDIDVPEYSKFYIELKY